MIYVNAKLWYCYILIYPRLPNITMKSAQFQRYGSSKVVTQVNRVRLTKLAQLVDQKNNISIHVDKTFSLDEAGKALDYLKDVHPRGKIVLAL
jgi:NADPH:quinone reductase-like Zn-dependent oxidoreductase